MSRTWEGYLHTNATFLAAITELEPMTLLSNPATLTTFCERLNTCERYEYLLNDYDKGFIRELREHFDTREDAMDMGARHLWNPSTNQWNYLINVWEKVK